MKIAQKPAIALAFAFGALLGCKSTDRNQPQLIKIRIVDALEATNTHIFVAEKKGYFRAHGLAPEINYVSSGKVSMDTLNGKGADYAGVVDMTVAQSLFRTTDLAVLSEMSQHVRSLKVLGRTDQGVRSARDLPGKRLGVLFGVSANLFLVKYLEAVGIDPKTIKLQNLQPPEADAAFKRGDIDAIVTWQPHAFRLQNDQALAGKVVVLTDDDRYWPNLLLIATRQSYLAGHADEAKQFLAAILEADDFIQNHPEETQALIAEHLRLTPEEVKSFYSEVSFGIRLRPLLLDNFKGDIAWQSANFQGGKRPLTEDYRSLLAPQLKELRPAAVTAY